MSDTDPCVVVGCHLRGQHAPSCENTDLCPGCLVRLQDGDLLVCGFHHGDTLRLLGLLPELDDALAIALKPYRSPQAPKPAGAPSFDRPDGVNSTATAARQTLKRMLRGNAMDVALARGYHMPPDQVEGLVEFLIVNLDWIHRDPGMAPTWYGWVRTLAQSSRRAAFPQRQEGNYLGPCPVLLPVINPDGRTHHQPCAAPIRFDGDRYREDHTYEPACPNCGTTGSLRWWADQIAGRLDQLDVNLTSGQLSQWLNWGLRRGDISPSMIRGWKRDGHLTEAGRNDRNQPLYDRNQAEAYARIKYRLPALEEMTG